MELCGKAVFKPRLLRVLGYVIVSFFLDIDEFGLLIAGLGIENDTYRMP
jgi:hypothetical protein